MEKEEGASKGKGRNRSPTAMQVVVVWKSDSNGEDEKGFIWDLCGVSPDGRDGTGERQTKPKSKEFRFRKLVVGGASTWGGGAGCRGAQRGLRGESVNSALATQLSLATECLTWPSALWYLFAHGLFCPMASTQYLSVSFLLPLRIVYWLIMKILMLWMWVWLVKVRNLYKEPILDRKCIEGNLTGRDYFKTWSLVESCRPKVIKSGGKHILFFLYTPIRSDLPFMQWNVEMELI